MKYAPIPLILFLLSACTLEQQDGDLRVVPGPLLARPQWHITQQAEQGNTRICTVSAGEVEVTARSDAGQCRFQVATRESMPPGDGYKLIMQNHVYETRGAVFPALQSAAIIADMQAQQMLYTEHSTIDLLGHRRDRVLRWSNNISLEGFAGQWQACRRYACGG